MIRRLLPSIAALTLAACGSQAPRPAIERTEPVAVPGLAPVAKPAVPQTHTLKKGGGYYQDDGPGENAPDNLDAIPDAVPRIEPLHRFANNPYAVFGRDYVPLRTLKPYRTRGVASWYGRKFHGQNTSSGEPYNMFGMTAAHPTLPIPSYARVTNPANGKSVVVRINDRGPFHAGRLIDLSYTAAWKLGYIGSGSTLVEVESLLPGQETAIARTPVADGDDPIARFAADVEPAPARTTTAVAATGATGAWLQLGAFGNPDNAETFRNHIARELDWLADRVVIQPAGKVVRVQVGPYRDRNEAEGVAERIRTTFGVKPTILLR